MIAAIFPVAIQQSQYTSTEGSAAAIARGAVNSIGLTIKSEDMPAPVPPGPPPPATPRPRARVYSLRDPQQARPLKTQFGPWLADYTAPGWMNREQLWDRVKGSLINVNDPRYGYVLLYRRDPGSAYAQVFVVVTQSRVRRNYEPSKDLVVPPAGLWANLQARPVTVAQLTSDGEGPRIDQQITFRATDPGFAALAEGCFVIISNSNLSLGSPPNPARQGWFNGRIYRLGNKVSNITYELMPGYDFQKDVGPDGSSGLRSGDTTDDVTGLTNADAFVVGRTYVGGSEPWDGPAQDVAVYTTFVQLR
jgi:hypothetical protein